MADDSATSRWTPARRRLLLEALCQADDDVPAIVRSLEIRLPDLAALADDAQLHAAMDMAERLYAFRSAQYLRRYQVHAVTRLIQLANQDDDAELARKASVELLKADFDPHVGRWRGNRGDTSACADEAASLDTQAVLDALERLGADDAPPGERAP